MLSLRYAGLVLAVLVSLPVQAQMQMPGPNLAPPPVPPTGLEQQTPLFTAPRQAIDDRTAFNSSERWIIQTFYERVREKQRRAARSKKYDRELPAGLAADPVKGDVLPMDLLARLDRLPGPLQRNLPPARPNTDRVLVGKNVLMVSAATGEVLDVLPGMVF